MSAVIAASDASETPLFLVGGPFRDLLLNISPSLDLDLVVEGDAIAVADKVAFALSRERGGGIHPDPVRVKAHPAFGTATIAIQSSAGVGASLGDGGRAGGAAPRGGEGGPAPRRTLTIDIATARTETYAHPGALPKTTPAPIEQDLLRRDFTINAIALRLNSPNRGAWTGVRLDEILDPTNGLADLEARLIRILHAHSFQDDPTRIIRAARYAARLGFRIERRTLTRLKRGTPYLSRISGARLHRELTRIFEEPAPETTLRHLGRLGVLTAIHPALRFEHPETATVRRLRKLAVSHVGQGFTLLGATTRTSRAPSTLTLATPQLVGQGFTLTPSARAAHWSTLALRLTLADAAALATRLALTRPQRAAVEAMPQLRDKLSTLNFQLSTTRSALATLLTPFPLPALWAFAAASTGIVPTQLLDYLTDARQIRPILSGDHLIVLGVPQGPAVGDILRRLHAAKLDGEVKTKTDEIRLVQTIIKVGDLEGGMVVGQRLACEESTRAGL